MKKYLAKLIFNVSIENSHEQAEFDEQIRIVESRNLEEAFYKARNIGRKEEETFSNQQQYKINWQFIDVAELYAIESVKDGEQLYSNTHKTNDAENFIQYIKQKSMEIQVKNLTFA
jgi:hypothetical protein